jgi:hypothetical protein
MQNHGQRAVDDDFFGVGYQALEWSDYWMGCVFESGRR